MGIYTDAKPSLISAKMWYNPPMRLTPEKHATLKQTLSSLSNEANLYLFCSRTHDTKKSGDIDLLVISDKPINMKGY